MTFGRAPLNIGGFLIAATIATTLSTGSSLQPASNQEGQNTEPASSLITTAPGTPEKADQTQSGPDSAEKAVEGSSETAPTINQSGVKRTQPAAEHAVEGQDNCAGRDVLNTFRTAAVGTSGGLELGLKTYPQTLKLADHEVVLTFDDGPLPKTTGRVLDALKSQCVRATFFLIGRNAEAHPELVRRELREHHTIGHHTWSHPSITLRGLSDEAGRLEVTKGIAADELAAYGEATPSRGPHVPFFRFPGFADTPQLLTWLGAQNIVVFGADLWASDWLSMTPEAELTLVLSRLDRLRRGIILFHDTRASTATMLPKFLRELKVRNYHVVHIVPGPDTPTIERAPAGWSSETEAIIGRVMSRLLSRAKLDAAREKPQRMPKSMTDPPKELSEPAR
jgi:peptidoglycan/xylan/chitin deacetylase (PgdA/CDA1 family)